MKLIVGLGNPGKEYENTRHNIGFLVADAIVKNEGFIRKKKEKKFHAEISYGNILTRKVLLVKPQTFMNRSGDAVLELKNFYKIEAKDIFVIHDDLDLPVAAIRISHNASSGGHKGVESIIDRIGTKEFVQFRVGIAGEERGYIPGEEYVLGKFSPQEQDTINSAITLIIEALEMAISIGVPEAMNEFN